MVWGNRGFDPNLQGSRFTHWETWLSEQEVFAPPGVTLARNAAGRVLLPLSRPRQFNHFIGKGTRTAALPIRSGTSRIHRFSEGKRKPTSSGQFKAAPNDRAFSARGKEEKVS
jgi:hypothetical protein